jgi:hypothetical protein
MSHTVMSDAFNPACLVQGDACGLLKVVPNIDGIAVVSNQDVASAGIVPSEREVCMLCTYACMYAFVRIYVIQVEVSMYVLRVCLTSLACFAALPVNGQGWEMHTLTHTHTHS